MSMIDALKDKYPRYEQPELLELTDEQLEKLHQVFLELLSEVDRICRKHGIEYTLDGGTLLGAIRHKGFIPWDDDADIVFTRDEYRKFYKACKRELNTDEFFLQEYRTDKAYPWGYAKFRRQGTELIQPGQEHIPFNKGIYIDVFIYDQVPDGYITRRLHHAACYCLRKCEYSVVGKLTAKSVLMRWWYSKLDKIPKDLLFAVLNFLAALTNGEVGKKHRLKNWKRDRKSELASHKTYPYFRDAVKYGMPASSYDEYMDVIFEDRTLRIIKDYDRYMTLLYGDYMGLPPEEDRKPKLPIVSLKFRE